MLRGATLLALVAVLIAALPNAPAAEPPAAPAQQQAAPEYINPSSRTPFSEGVRYGGVIYLSGKLGLGRDAERGVQPETRRALENIRAALEGMGSSMDRVLKCTVMLADMAEWGAMNEVYAEFFPENKPARSAFGVSGLAADARVEIECMAAA